MPPKRAKKTPAAAGTGTAAAASAPPAHIQTTGVKRPGFGKAGRPITVKVNHFVCTIPTGIIYHYDGACLPRKIVLAYLFTSTLHFFLLIVGI